MKTHPSMRMSHIFRAYYSKGGGHHHWCLAETQRQAKGWGRLPSGRGQVQGVPVGTRKLQAAETSSASHVTG